MYDSHIYSKSYRGFKQTIIDIMNGDDDVTDIEKLEKHIQEVYEDGKLQSSQYDELMGYLQEIKFD